MTTGKIAAVRRLLDTGEVSCAELTRRYLDAIGRDNERLNAYVTVTAETALAAAEEVDRRRAAGEAPAPLEGVPMTLKDNISTAGIETTGSDSDGSCSVPPVLSSSLSYRVVTVVRCVP